MTIEEVKRIKVIKVKCDNSFAFFVRYMFKEIHKIKFTVKPFHKELFDVAERIFSGELTRIIINIPPRYSKTEIFVKMFIAYGIYKNSRSKFMHLSYSDQLALDNAAAAKEYIESEAFQILCPISLKKDTKAKGCYHTEDGGVVYSTSSKGPVTGFGAGVMDSEEFAGALIWDDPHKPEDAKSDIMRSAVNDRYSNTIRSRTNDPKTPIVVIMQRLHEEDLSGYLLNGGSKEDWYHVKIPVYDINNDPIFPEKHDKAELQSMSSDAYTFAGQYMQEPAPLDGGKIKREWFEIVDSYPEGTNDMYIDGAYTKNTTNDPTGIMITRYDRKTDTMYILNTSDDYLEMPELIDEVKKQAQQYSIKRRSSVRIEPKASGLSLKQLLIRNTDLNAIAIKGKQVSDGKIGRADACSPTLQSGKVKIVRGNWNKRFLDQVTMFPNAKHDEQVDNLCYAVIDYFGVYRPKKTVRY